ncbi:phytanoyl-CoA dioxygenase family protein [Colwellia sp. MB02u-18]|uniref:phytanoyl-CoA dioxygenase family protein n=1 Tax=unclassified Colwellia TaxID=196834 RepID=UPI0015F43EAC|nr:MULTISPECIES: phytanoyl-CoA dioxygenase family protein [unclassified Colwellia]MBA6224032.1 phytanoyl-CoA dioxygenase family protein [Colwellia sp. MB3u-45]MBA6266505.1 phytanoyl-CoA dioxygenase family protein [Colwellia sp. MB3u-43]MBA6320213.1 phytanoyl-CoA dioxygenase family protein [Colwellia sp. MB02u-19]MBA6326024.1 phytanoyl-CoA dioxygenase family protein [Colwellia sp. MB02u-18]MBA6332667.1 phytanoyl-CoA dioxygenase family protein [Colwellia sp. MB02u-12]
MVENRNQLQRNYDQQGYFVIRNYFTVAEIAELRAVVLKFHQLWQQDNAKFYQEEAFNSSLITGSEYLAFDDRVQLFNFISSKKIMDVVEAIVANNPAFMNTQLFFNPVNLKQKDFWHRDCQYDHDVAGQKLAIKQTQVLHLRVPLFDELGMELVPGTHKRWDNDEEFNVRQEEKGSLSSDDLASGEKIKLAAGDLLVFSADMIHRGLYGLDRLALDILVFDSAGDFADYVDDDCLPDSLMLDKIDDPRLFINTLNLKSNS